MRGTSESQLHREISAWTVQTAPTWHVNRYRSITVVYTLDVSVAFGHPGIKWNLQQAIQHNLSHDRGSERLRYILPCRHLF